MKLIYMYIFNYKNASGGDFSIKDTGISFSSDYHCEYHGSGSDFIIKKNEDNLKNFYDRNIEDVKVLIGNNGSGKTTLLDLLGMSHESRTSNNPQAKDGSLCSEYFFVYHYRDDKFFIEFYTDPNNPWEIFTNWTKPKNKTDYFYKTPMGHLFQYNFHQNKIIVFKDSTFCFDKDIDSPLNGTNHSKETVDTVRFCKTMNLYYFSNKFSSRHSSIIDYNQKPTTEDYFFSRKQLALSSRGPLDYKYSYRAMCDERFEGVFRNVLKVYPKINVSLNSLPFTSSVKNHDIKTKNDIIENYLMNITDLRAKLVKSLSPKDLYISNLYIALIDELHGNILDLLPIPDEESTDVSSETLNIINLLGKELGLEEIFHKKLTIPKNISSLHYRDMIQEFNKIIFKIENWNTLTEDILPHTGNIIIERLRITYIMTLKLLYLIEEDLNIQSKKYTKNRKTLRFLKDYIKIIYNLDDHYFLEKSVSISAEPSPNPHVLALFDLFQKSNLEYDSVFKERFELKFSQFSDGEVLLLDIYSKLLNVLDEDRETHIVILDEPQRGLHPDWARRFLNMLVDTLRELNKPRGDDKLPIKVQFIISTHSPFILSDVKSDDIILLKDPDSENRKLELANDHFNSFGANIHDILSDAFFFKGKTVGEFAYNKMKSELNILTLPDDSFNEENYEKSLVKLINAKKIIHIVGDPLLKKSLLVKWNAKYTFLSALKESLTSNNERTNRAWNEFEGLSTEEKKSFIKRLLRGYSKDGDFND